VIKLVIHHPSKKEQNGLAPPSHPRSVDTNTTKCRFEFARQSLHDNMAWMAHTSTGGEIRLSDGKFSAAGDKPKKGSILEKMLGK